MKYILSHFVLIFVLLFSLCGCNQVKVTEHAAISDLVETEQSNKQYTEKETLENDDITEEMAAVEKTEVREIQFDDEDHTNKKLYDVSTADYLSVPQTYSELKNWLNHDKGIILAGYAFGKRHGYLGKEIYTLTEFQVEKVYMGQVEARSIRIRENYCPNTMGGEEVLQYQGHRFTQLKDGQKTLLYLLPTKMAGVYEPIYYEIPLPEDYQNLSDTEKGEIFAFYRGDPAVYKKVPGESYTEMVQNPDGTISMVHHIAGEQYWPERTLSNEELLRELQEHILLQTVEEYHIKIWPMGHIRYSAKENSFSKEGMVSLSIPD